MQQSELEAESTAKHAVNLVTDNVTDTVSTNIAKKPEADDLQKLMKERFGDAKFGTLMDSIVDQMFKNMAEVKPTFVGTEKVD